MATYSVNNSNNRFTFSLTLNEGSYDVASNTSPVSYYLTLQSNASYHFSMYTIGYNVMLNGATVASGSQQYDISSYGSISFCSGTVTVTHSADGSYNLPFSYSMTMRSADYTPGNLSDEGVMTLSTIPRASSITSITSSVVANDSERVTINIHRNSSAFTHTVRIKFGTYQYEQSGVGETMSYAIPSSWLNAIPNTKEGTASVSVQTYNGGNTVGDPLPGSFKITIPNYKPTIASLTATRVDGSVPSNWGIYVQGKSRATLTINGASVGYGARISSYSISGAGYSSTSYTFTTDVINAIGTVSFTAVVTDSRGIPSDPVSCNITVYEYEPPAITSALSQRCLSNRELNNDGQYVKATGTFRYSSCNGKNTHVSKIYFRKVGEDYGSYTLFNSGEAVLLGSNNISTDSTYEIKYEISDSFETKSYTDTVSTAFFLIDVLKGGKGLSVGKAAEDANVLDIGMNIRFRQGVVMDSPLSISNGGTGANNAYTALENLGARHKVYVGSAGIQGTNGYVKIARIYIQAGWANAPIRFTISQRAVTTTTVTMIFAGVSDTNTYLSYFGKSGGSRVFLSNVDTGVFDMYVMKVDAWDVVSVIDCDIDAYMRGMTRVDYIENTLVSTLPSNSVEASYGYDVFGMSDTICEQAVNGNWYYQKYTSGYCTLYGFQNYYNVSIVNQWGYLYESTVYRLDYPFYLSSVYTCVLTPQTVGGAVLGLETQNTVTNTQSPMFYFTRGTSGTVERIDVLATVCGRWKE